MLQQVSEIATSQVQAIQTQQDSRDKELTSLRQQLVDFQAQSNDKTVIGRFCTVVFSFQLTSTLGRASRRRTFGISVAVFIMQAGCHSCCPINKINNSAILLRSVCEQDKSESSWQILVKFFWLCRLQDGEAVITIWEWANYFTSLFFYIHCSAGRITAEFPIGWIPSIKLWRLFGDTKRHTKLIVNIWWK